MNVLKYPHYWIYKHNSSKPSKLSYSTSIQPVESGGSNLIDLKWKTKSMKLNWIRHSCHSNGSSKVVPSLIINNMKNDWIHFFP